MRLSKYRAGILTVLTVAAISGCGGPADDGLSKSDQTLVSRLDQIVKKSGGNWDALSADDKAYLVKEVGYGDERNAKMYFLSQTGGLKGHAGPPTGGPPNPAAQPQ